MQRRSLPLAILLVLSPSAFPQSDLLEPAVGSPEVVAYQLSQHLFRRARAFELPPSAADWERQAARMRQRLLGEVVFHGWPREWVDAPLRYEDLGTIPSGPGYRMRRLRIEIVPGFQTTAIVYEPEKTGGPRPAILNVNGHVGAPGKAVEYKQKRCINQALQGIIALNLEWVGMGELRSDPNSHWYAAHLDLVGANGLGLFYLAMRKGLDFLYQHPDVDKTRIGMTGLSGGGWQTIVLSALDERIAVAVPVAGYTAITSRIERPKDTGDIEQNATDMVTVADYSQLTAMRAPRPTLLVYNAEDDCCFRAPLVKPFIFDSIRPLFRLLGKEDHLAWHENTDPSDHNYQLDNRLQAYRFFARHFGLPEVRAEIPVGDQVKSYEELAVGLPADNLTILGLARTMAAGIQRRAGSRERLREIVRLPVLEIERLVAVGNTKSKGLESRAYRFDFSDGLSAAGVWLAALDGTHNRSATIVMNGEGKKAARAEVMDRVSRGEHVLALDLLFMGDAAPTKPPAHSFVQMLGTVGERALGIEAAQLLAAARWLRRQSGAGQVRLDVTGFRSHVLGAVAAALDPEAFGEIVVRKGIRSLSSLLEVPVRYEEAPELFCLDLYKDFDLDSLEELARPTRFLHPPK